ncbi:(d)CMP kinase [Elizabethkingia argentiflava]|uniref:Cytidylate kinase n=1 Tax=Elizabethkingia argenteiflava TaxID=2681556 RepID=A0A845PYH0_9FLAO|nr:(d)CMP kinase [Elizabethkingia argenteiflava]NAW51130.1 (d)CMP kinase [Elizabethkingia argenteiflava]
MKKKPLIAIDGFSSTGKSSISKIIAQKLGVIHMDTGALYRGITVYALQHFLEGNTINIPQLIHHLSDIKLEFKSIKGHLSLFLNDTNIDPEIRAPKVAEYVSEVAKQPEIRNFLLCIQRQIAKNGGIVMDGRDIGTVVLPQADYKFFLTASPQERALRRYKELKENGIEADLEEVKRNLLMRDKIDSERPISPLKQAPDAILIDNTHLDKKQTIALILSYLK